MYLLVGGMQSCRQAFDLRVFVAYFIHQVAYTSLIVRLSRHLRNKHILLDLKYLIQAIFLRIYYCWLAHGQRDVSLLSGCQVMYLLPYCAGVTQCILPL